MYSPYEIWITCHFFHYTIIREELLLFLLFFPELIFFRAKLWYHEKSPVQRKQKERDSNGLC